MPVRALRRCTEWVVNIAHNESESKNARKGIKTHLISIKIFGDLAPSESKNARKGIKTYPSLEAPLARVTVRIKKCP